MAEHHVYTADEQPCVEVRVNDEWHFGVATMRVTDHERIEYHVQWHDGQSWRIDTFAVADVRLDTADRRRGR